MSWELDEFQCWNLRRDGVHIWLNPRPVYCDRGRWLAHVQGIESIDFADGFPRYYMDLERAKLELDEWLTWRLQTEQRR